MRPHAVLSRRGALGLAALLHFARPPAAAGASGTLLPGQAIQGEVLEIGAFGRGTCLDPCGLEPIYDVRTGEADGPSFPEARGVPPLAPWGWGTLENVR